MSSADLSHVLQFLSAANPLMGDINKACENIRKSFENNYINRIFDAAKNEREEVKKRPSREIILLRALKNYMPPGNAAAIESVIETINTINTISSIQRSIAVEEKPFIKSAEKDGGAAPNPMLMEITAALMALSLINGK